MEEDKDKPELEDIVKSVKEDINEKGAAIFFVGSDGEMSMITTGVLSKHQKDVCTKMLVASGNHSIILSVVLWLEIKFEKIIYSISEWISPNKTG
jgi:hypothetical protein